MYKVSNVQYVKTQPQYYSMYVQYSPLARVREWSDAVKLSEPRAVTLRIRPVRGVEIGTVQRGSNRGFILSTPALYTVHYYRVGILYTRARDNVHVQATDGDTASLSRWLLAAGSKGYFVTSSASQAEA